jgi:hypothetical protein
MKIIDPFANESESYHIENLNVENRTDRVTIYGDIDITRDKKGLEAARKMADLMKSIVEKLESEDLPETIPPPQNVDTVENPFE